MDVRPKAGETDEDILKLQEIFLKSKAKPAATTVKEKCPSQDNQVETSATIFQKQVANTFEAIPANVNIGSIIERNPNACTKKGTFLFHQNDGFPKARRRDLNKSQENKGSIFSQQIKKMKTDSDVPMEVDKAPSPEKTVIISSLTAKSKLLNDDEKNSIHSDNVNVINSMSEKEIFEERDRLLALLQAKNITFLTDKRKQRLEVAKTSSIQAQNETEDVNIGDLETPSEILKHPEAEKWLHFDTVETNKFMWMKNVEIPSLKEGQQYEARFDFDGWILPFTESEISEKSRSLYHHGDEPGRPGYTLQELLQLSRSSVNQQKIVALNTISEILALCSIGVYDDVEIPIEQIFFVIRVSLDDNTPPVLNSAIKAMRNLFFYPIDETCLDNVLSFGLGLIQPVLSVDESEDDNTVNDQQLAEINLIKCLFRTDILIRIKYIVDVIHPPMETTVYVLELLTRLSRDSQFIAEKVFACEGLIESIVKHFVPQKLNIDDMSSAYGLPLVQAVKFLRILSTRSSLIAGQLIVRYQVMDSVASYLSNEAISTNTNGLKLQIESLHLFSTFVCYNLALNYFRSLEPILLRMLDFHIRNTGVTFSTSYVIQGNVAALLNLITQVTKIDYKLVMPYISLLMDPAFIKWTAQFGLLDKFSCGKLQIITATLNCFSNLCKHNSFESVETSVMSLLNSSGFELVTRNIKSGSNLLSNFKTRPSSANLKSLQAALFTAADHVIPALNTTSCIPFLVILSDLINNLASQIQIKFLQHKNITNYLRLLQKADDYSLTSNWYSKFESQLIMNVLKMSIKVGKEIDTSIYYDLAVKCLSIFNCEQKQDIDFILRNIILSPQFYPNEVLLNSMHINEPNILLHLNHIYEVYKQVLGLQKDVPITSLSINSNISNIIPFDWIFSPIIALYSNLQKNPVKSNEDEQIYVVTNCLRWIYIYETYFPTLAAQINVTDRFCRLACVFLINDNIFFNVEVKQLLEMCLQCIVNKQNELNFDKPIEGLSNFQDFFVQLLEQYQGVSYGDVLFGNFILVPLAQRHNVKWKKTLWSEYSGVVEIFNVTSDQVAVPIESFLEPSETDLSVLKCYRRFLAMKRIRQHSVLYRIAHHHVEAFLKGNEKT